jgi:hypothetical protein
LLHHCKIAVALLVVLVSIFPAGVFATPTTGPTTSQPRNNSAGNEIASLDRQSQPSNGKQNFKLISTSAYKDSIGSLHVVGELQNTSPDPREYVQIVSTLHDASDNIVDTGFTYTKVEVLRPGEKSPFDVIFSNEQQVQKTQRYEISSITGDVSQEKPPNLKLNVGDRYYDSIGTAHVVGEGVQVFHITPKSLEHSTMIKTKQWQQNLPTPTQTTSNRVSQRLLI